MSDLIPLALLFLGIALAVVAVALQVKRPHRAARVPIVILVAPVVSLAGCYLAFVTIHGDPDVWDFYASVWWLPLAVAGVYVLLVSLCILRRRQHSLPTPPS